MDGKIVFLFPIVTVLLSLNAAADVLFDQSFTVHDITTTSEYVAEYNIDSRTADDFALDPGIWYIDNVFWWIGFWKADWISPDSFKIYIYEDDGGQPSNPVTGGEWWEYFTTSWEEQVDDPLRRYTFDIDIEYGDMPEIPGETRFWIVPQPAHVFPPQMGPACCEQILWGEPIYFGSDYFGYPNWEPGNQVFARDLSSHFILSGYETGIESASLGEIKALFK